MQIYQLFLGLFDFELPILKVIQSYFLIPWVWDLWYSGCLQLISNGLRQLNRIDLENREEKDNILLVMFSAQIIRLGIFLGYRHYVMG